jgi:hypothetical protein
MKLYGYSQTDSDELQSLSEVSVLASRDELLALAAFFAKCAFEIQTEENWDHAHFCDFFGDTSEPGGDIIVATK